MGLRRLCHALAIVAVALASGCSDQPQVIELGELDGLDGLDGMVASEAPLLIAPDHYWDEDEASGHWGFRHYARLVLWVAPGTEGPIDLELVPHASCVGQHLELEWNGVPLAESAGRVGADGATLELPAELVTPGVHQLMLRRRFAAEDADVRANPRTSFRDIVARTGEAELSLASDDRSRLRLLGDHLLLGVAGSGQRKLSGCLMDGSATASLNLRLDSPAVASFRVENAGARTAVFSLSGGAQYVEAEVAPREQVALELELEGGRQQLELTVHGASDGLYLWGAPYLARQSPKPAGPPAVVLVTLDTTRKDALSMYGGPLEASPVLQKVAEGATVFTNAHATSPWTLPSHASLFTGLYPSHHQAGVATDILPATTVTLAEVLRRHGYVTAGLAGGALAASRWGLGQGFMEYLDPEGFETRGDRLTDAALEVLERHRGRPLFLFVNYFDPHALYRAPAPFNDRFGVEDRAEQLEGVEGWSDLVAGDGEAWRAIVAGEVDIHPAAIDYLRAAYHAEVAFMDHQLGRLLEGLEGQGLIERSLLVLVADHGELLGEGGFFSHACRLDPELTEVPLLIRWPGQLSGQRSEQLVSHVDLFDTVLELVGARSRPGDGYPLQPGALTAAIESRTVVLLEEHEHRIHPLFDSMRIAPHVYGAQELRYREVVWDGGIMCEARSAGGWLSEPCAAPWQRQLAWISDHLERPAGGGGTEAGLTAADRKRLEALGYVE